jgi:hypothetical protein
MFIWKRSQTGKETSMGSYREQYYTLKEEEMQALIKRSKEGDEKASIELLNVFSNFLTKYVTMLYVGKYSINDYDIRRFISLFIKDAYVRFALMKNKLNSDQSKIVFEAMNRNQLHDKKILYRRRSEAHC